MKIKNTEQKYIKNDFDNLPSSIENEDEHVVDVESEIGEKITKTLEVNTSHPMVEFQPALPDYDEY